MSVFLHKLFDGGEAAGNWPHLGDPEQVKENQGHDLLLSSFN